MFYSHILDGLRLITVDDLFLTFEYRGSCLKLPCVAVQERNKLPKYCQGLYFLIEYLEIVYIGATCDIKRRWSGHLTLEQVNTSEAKIAWFPVDHADLMYYFECKLIDHFKPKLNKQMNYQDRIIKVIRADHPSLSHHKFDGLWDD